MPEDQDKEVNTGFGQLARRVKTTGYQAEQAKLQQDEDKEVKKAAAKQIYDSLEKRLAIVDALDTFKGLGKMCDAKVYAGIYYQDKDGRQAFPVQEFEEVKEGALPTDKLIELISAVGLNGKRPVGLAISMPIFDIKNNQKLASDEETYQLLQCRVDSTNEVVAATTIRTNMSHGQQFPPVNSRGLRYSDSQARFVEISPFLLNESNSPLRRLQRSVTGKTKHGELISQTRKSFTKAIEEILPSQIRSKFEQ